MSLNSDASVIPPCGECFWEVDGHQRVIKRTENGSHMCNELAKLILERAEIEREYAKRLKSWSCKWTESVENGKLHSISIDYLKLSIHVCVQ